MSTLSLLNSVVLSLQHCAVLLLIPITSHFLILLTHFFLLNVHNEVQYFYCRCSHLLLARFDFLTACYRRFEPSRMLNSVVGQRIIDDSKKCNVFIFRVNRIFLESLTLKMKPLQAIKFRKMFTYPHSIITSQNTFIFSCYSLFKSS